MIINYWKQYRLWYALYVIMSLSFLGIFWLYHFPPAYFVMAVLFNGVLLLVITGFTYYRFYHQMRVLTDFLELRELADFQKPLDLAYQSALLNRVQQANAVLDKSRQKQMTQQNMIKLWAHQMKVPLSAISLMVQTDRLDKQEISQQVLRIEGYLNTLLSYLKFQENKDDFRFEVVSVADVAKGIIKKNRIFFLQKQLSVSVSGDWQLKTDKKWLTFALGQVVDNAIKYTPSGGAIRIQLDDNSVTISDTGIGILPEDIPRLFEEGFTGFNGHEHQKASGLGLYMTKQILDQLGLSIVVTSQLEQGTQVRISKTSSC